jgi:steroid delta-isomerase-like uncharacterized protein
MGPEESSLASRNREIIRRFYEELWNRFDKGKMVELLTEDFRFRGSLGQETRGRDGFAGYLDMVARGFPDFTNQVEEIISEGDRAFARLRYRGTHRGEILGVAATGRQVEYAGAAVFAFRKDHIAGLWVLGDLHGLLAQLKGSGSPSTGTE